MLLNTVSTMYDVRLLQTPGIHGVNNDHQPTRDKEICPSKSFNSSTLITAASTVSRPNSFPKNVCTSLINFTAPQNHNVQQSHVQQLAQERKSELRNLIFNESAFTNWSVAFCQCGDLIFSFLTNDAASSSSKSSLSSTSPSYFYPNSHRVIRVYSLSSRCVISELRGFDSPISFIFYRNEWCECSDRLVIRTVSNCVYVCSLSCGQIEFLFPCNATVESTAFIANHALFPLEMLELGELEWSGWKDLALFHRNFYVELREKKEKRREMRRNKKKIGTKERDFGENEQNHHQLNAALMSPPSARISSASQIHLSEPVSAHLHSTRPLQPLALSSSFSTVPGSNKLSPTPSPAITAASASASDSLLSAAAELFGNRLFDSPSPSPVSSATAAVQHDRDRENDDLDIEEYERRMLSGLTHEVCVWENQRYYPIKGWAGVLLPSDFLPSWSNESGNRSLHKDDFRVLDGWQWLDDWHILYDNTNTGGEFEDEDGWSYAFDFKKRRNRLVWESTSKHKGVLQNVRRRCWIRYRSQPPSTMHLSKTVSDLLLNEQCQQKEKYFLKDSAHCLTSEILAEIIGERQKRVEEYFRNQKKEQDKQKDEKEKNNATSSPSKIGALVRKLSSALRPTEDDSQGEITFKPSHPHGEDYSHTPFNVALSTASHAPATSTPPSTPGLALAQGQVMARSLTKHEPSGLQSRGHVHANRHSGHPAPSRSPPGSTPMTADLDPMTALYRKTKHVTPSAIPASSSSSALQHTLESRVEEKKFLSAPSAASSLSSASMRNSSLDSKSVVASTTLPKSASFLDKFLNFLLESDQNPAYTPPKS